MPENEAPIRAFYDHETDEPRATGRRRRQVADWGVGEDVFDRLPTRRFARGEHRHAEPAPRGRHDDFAGRQQAARAADGRRDDLGARREAGGAQIRRDDLDGRREAGGADGRRDDVVGPRPAGGAESGRDDFAGRRQATDARRDDLDWPAEAAARGGAAEIGGRGVGTTAGRPRRRPAADWLEEVSPRPADRPVVETDGPRTIVIGGAVADELASPAEDSPIVDAAVTPRAEGARPRRTVVIGGHPDRLPAPRQRRPPRTALDSFGASPDRLAAYAVALGLLLILIAVLTTSH
jgi:hypothetical protein